MKWEGESTAVGRRGDTGEVVVRIDRAIRLAEVEHSWR